VTGNPDIKKNRGRPKTEEKRHAIVAAARRLFMTTGFGQSSMDAIAAEAGVSKATLYSHFADKEALFQSVMLAEIESHPVLEEPAADDAESFRAALESFGHRLLAILTNPEIQAMERTMLVHREQFPKLMKVLFENGPRRMQRDVSRLLRRGVEAGRLRPMDADAVAEHLMCMCKGLRLRQQEMGLAGRPSKATIRKHVASCVDLVMRAYGT
jgi:TetR/AcrR family transcriptional repressor of mexJK operon